MLKALLFDLDGTLVDTEREGHLRAFNEIFAEFGLDWKWSLAMYHELLKITGGRHRIKYYLKKYRPDFHHDDLDNFVAEIHRRKTDRFVEFVGSGQMTLRPGIRRLLNEARERGIKLGIATTTTPDNVYAIIQNTLGPSALEWFAVIGAGGMVKNLKPAADVYLYVLEKLGLRPDECLAFEDSQNGIRSADNAKLRTLITITEWTREQDFSGALAVLDHLGEPDRPFTMIAGAKTKHSFVNIDYLKELHAANY